MAMGMKDFLKRFCSTRESGVNTRDDGKADYEILELHNTE